MNMRLHPYGSGVHIHNFNERSHVTAEQGKSCSTRRPAVRGKEPGTPGAAPVITTSPSESKSDFFLSANCVSGEITVTLDNNNMWNEFYRCNTEMVLAKQGRRMFPYCRYWISGLNPHLKYILVMDITPLDNYRHKWNGKWWEPGGKADPHVLGRVFIHPESPSTGQYWMHQPVSFYKLKLTNNILDQDGHIILHSMHRYLPRLHVVPAEKASEVIQLNGPDVHTFTFPQTEFIAVTAYQNFQITQLKIDCNPFAKGFREGMVTGRPGKDVKHKSESEVDSMSSKNDVENKDLSNMEKLQELFRMSEYLDCDKENERFSSVQDLLRFTKSKSELAKNSKQNEDVIERTLCGIHLVSNLSCCKPAISEAGDSDKLILKSRGFLHFRRSLLSFPEPSLLVPAVAVLLPSGLLPNYPCIGVVIAGSLAAGCISTVTQRVHSLSGSSVLTVTIGLHSDFIRVDSLTCDWLSFTRTITIMAVMGAFSWHRSAHGPYAAEVTPCLPEIASQRTDKSKYTQSVIDSNM
ncbi:unnamed protein product [Ranitomeya imitator]|uniref:T-box domain-containing protein n=1 Tax=Ranitomeya imitator TaxID=111125 RepID=A0ABN9L929_9NEOB|nr:unnamed protein product [Ranitomeya imitator]